MTLAGQQAEDDDRVARGAVHDPREAQGPPFCLYEGVATYAFLLAHKRVWATAAASRTTGRLKSFEKTYESGNAVPHGRYRKGSPEVPDRPGWRLLTARRRRSAVASPRARLRDDVPQCYVDNDWIGAQYWSDYRPELVDAFVQHPG